jgi:excisionase family DNA binding protein
MGVACLWLREEENLVEGTYREPADAVVDDRLEADGDASDPGLDEPLLTVDQTARLLAVKPGWVYAAVREGSLPSVRVGKHLRFIKADIVRWILERRSD